jgi:phosphatidylglycerol:prolipoprotein diacylglycerol transferase
MFDAFQIGPFLVWTRLIFLLLGIWLSVEFFLRLAERAGLSLSHFRTHAPAFLLAFVLGGRLVAIIAEYRIYLRDPLRMLILWDGGFSFLGGAIGIGIVLYLTTRSHRSTFLQWLDVLVPATTLGLCFSWLGEFFSGNSYGTPTDVFWGVTYQAENVRFAVPVHPVQLYYAFFYFILTFLLLVIRKRSKRVGAETLFGIVIAAIVTFVLEYFRGDFAIPVFATKADFVVLLALFVSLGLLGAVELTLSERSVLLYEVILLGMSAGYLFVRPLLELDTFELRFSQLLAILSLLATVVYVVVHRRTYPHL